MALGKKSGDVEKSESSASKEKLQEMLKRLSPSSTDSVVISDIPEHCARTMTLALNLEWFGHEGRVRRDVEGAEQPKRNVIVVRIEKLDMTLTTFISKIKEILTRID